MAGFPRAARLLGPDEFNRVFERRIAKRGRFFTVHLWPSGDLDPDAPETAETRAIGAALPANPNPRLGIVVPKKLLKTAVHRNLVKRIVREAFRLSRVRLPAVDVVVRLTQKINPKSEPPDRRAIADDIAALLGRLGRKGPRHET